MSLSARCWASRPLTSRIASDTSIAASNMDSALHRLATPSLAFTRCFSTLMTACVPARLPELNRTMTRSPARSNEFILQKLRKIVDLCMGTRVRGKNQSVVEHDADTVGHGCFSPFTRSHKNSNGRVIALIGRQRAKPDFTHRKVSDRHQAFIFQRTKLIQRLMSVLTIVGASMYAKIAVLASSRVLKCGDRPVCF